MSLVVRVGSGGGGSSLPNDQLLMLLRWCYCLQFWSVGVCNNMLSTKAGGRVDRLHRRRPAWNNSYGVSSSSIPKKGED